MIAPPNRPMLACRFCDSPAHGHIQIAGHDSTVNLCDTHYARFMACIEKRQMVGPGMDDFFACLVAMVAIPVDATTDRVYVERLR